MTKNKKGQRTEDENKMGKSKSGARRNSFGQVKSKRARNHFAQIANTVAGNTTTRYDTDTQILDRLVAAPCEVLAIHRDTPILDGRLAACPDLCSSSDEDLDEDLDDETVSPSWMTQHLNRLLVSAQYSRAYGSPPKWEWRGRDGTFAQISRVFPDVSRAMIKRVVRETNDCERMGVKYTGMQKNREFKGLHLIPRNSLYERMVCDLLERGLGIHHTTLLVNSELKGDGFQEVGASCVRDTYHRLGPAIIQIRKVAMGTNDAHSAWAKASFNISKQLAICFGVLNPHIILDPPMPDPLPVNDGSVAGASAATLTLPVVTTDGDIMVANQVSTEVVNPAPASSVVLASASASTATLTLPVVTDDGDSMVINQVPTEVVNPAPYSSDGLASASTVTPTLPPTVTVDGGSMVVN